MRTFDYFNEDPSENHGNDLRRLNKSIYLQWKKFISGENDVDTTIVSQETLDGWLHCRELNIDPLAKPQNVILTGDALHEKISANQEFINISRPFAQRLFQFTKDRNYSVGLMDKDGYLINVLIEEKHIIYNKMFNFVPGSRWTEEDAGNCPTAYALNRKQPVQMMGATHYMKYFHFVTTSAAPIFDPDGHLLGCISVSNFYLDTHPHTLFMAVAAAQAIENEWQTQKALVQCKIAFEQTDIAASLQKAIFSSIPEALIVVNHEGDIMTINEKASQMFALDNVSVCGMSLRKIFKGEENTGFLAVAEQKDSVSDKEVRIRTVQGAGDYSLTCNSITLSGGALIGKLLIFSEIQRIKSLVARTIGAKANFTFKDIHCQNEHFKRILEQASVMSPSLSNVLLLGESGTGKDILAQAIHNDSPRKDGPYVAINCAAIPRDLIASELFGHDEGAFTGSRRGGSQGKFELADGGTIFLDEIAEMSLDIQAVLLRVIEDKCIVRIGGNQIRAIDVRIISATNRDLLAEVNRGNFRKDLYYRLNVFNIQLLPLRERQDDIPLLVEYFIRKYAKAQGKIIHGADEQVIDAFMNYRWPGNVRELQNVVERMVNYASLDHLTSNLIPPELVDTRPVRTQKLDFETSEEKEKRLLRHMLTLKLSKNNIALQLNMSRTTLYRKLRRHGLLRLDED